MVLRGLLITSRYASEASSVWKLLVVSCVLGKIGPNFDPKQVKQIFG